MAGGVRHDRDDRRGGHLVLRGRAHTLVARTGAGCARGQPAAPAQVLPKATNGVVESIRTLANARSAAVKARSAALLQLRDLIATAPAELREALPQQTLPAKARQCARFRPDRPARPTTTGREARAAQRRSPRRRAGPRGRRSRPGAAVTCGEGRARLPRTARCRHRERRAVACHRRREHRRTRPT